MRSMPEDRPLAPVETLTAGRLQLLLAPTGTGKSVLTSVLSLALAQQGIPVTLVVPRVADVWETTFELERDLACLDAWQTDPTSSDEDALPPPSPRKLRVAPLSSSRERFQQLAAHMAKPPTWDPSGEWALSRVGYACALRAYAEAADDENPLLRGEEPCHGLSEGRGPRATRRVCPFLTKCPLHQPERDALTADIVVINHHAFVVGLHRLPTTTTTDAVPRRRPYIESLLLRSGLILVDEVDVLQKALVDADSGNLPLASRGRVSPIHRLFAELEHYAARIAKPLMPHQDRTRRDLMSIQTVAHELTHLLERRLIEWNAPPELRFHGSSDAELIQQLLRSEHDETPTTIQDCLSLELLVKENPTTNSPLLQLSRLTRPFAEVQLDGPRTTDQRLTALLEALSQPLPSGRTLEQPQARARLRNLLVLRASLWRLERTLSQLGQILPELSRLPLPAVEPIQEALSASQIATLSPLGPLGKPVFGFSWQASESNPSPLRTLSLRGDPHTALALLGEGLALAMTGHRRVVLGLSATAWFPGSPLCHVHGDLRFLLPDPSRSIKFSLESVGPEISGVSEPEKRGRNMEELGQALWPRLEAERAHLQQDPATAGQSKMLLVTGSYVEALHAAQGLAQAMGGMPRSQQTLWVVQPTATLSPLYHTISPRDIETFGPSDAWILIAPLLVVSRGHNILQAPSKHDALQGSRSAVGGIYLLVRPVPSLSDASRLLAHVTATQALVSSELPALERITYEREQARRRYEHFLWNAGAFSKLPAELRHEVLCDVLVELAQLAGRARRGGTSAHIHLVDAAFTRPGGSWTGFVQESFRRWHRDGDLPGLVRAHGAFIRGRARLAEFPLESNP